MHEVLREKEVCDKCKKVTFKEEYITLCDCCDKEIPKDSDSWRYTMRMVKEEQPECNSHMGRDDWKFDFCSFECFIKNLKNTQNYKYDHIWGYNLNKEDIKKLLEMIR
ncbi:hypothetical protein LCGC14_0224290 [marine sediment metagenome]|uniref:Uncharacterized protein n=1 Tax=marine sediment metagenome TaxID=412755 RepID=A0A0F9WWU3_9ZZZZ